MKRTVVASVFSLFLLGYGHVQAAEPGYCDESVEDCDCVSGLDDCVDVPLSDLASPFDPADLRDEANITSEWNNVEGAWDVYIDTSAMPARGMMVVSTSKGSGQYDTLPEMFGYLSELIGQELQVQASSNGEVYFPRLIIHQDGATYRYDLDAKQWAPHQSNNLIFDAMTDQNGNVTVDGTTFALFAPSVTPGVPYCQGTDTYSHDVKTDNALKGSQCSSTNNEYVAFDDDACFAGENPLGLPGCDFIRLNAQTALETVKTLHWQKTVMCREVDIGGGVTICSEEDNFVNRRVFADLDVDNYYFLGGVFTESNATDLPYTDTTERVAGKTFRDGVCAEGLAERGSLDIDLNTRDGSYDSEDSICESVARTNSSND